MKISKAVSAARRAYAASPAGTGRFLLTEACLTLICLAPLLFLAVAGLSPLAWVSPVLWLLVLLPARMNAAAAMRDGLRGGDLGGKRLIETEGYGRKVALALLGAYFRYVEDTDESQDQLLLYGMWE